MSAEEGAGLGRYMMATKAIHKLGDISNDEPDLCYITDEDEENYIGHWVAGYGFMNVRFPKTTTRPLSRAEYDFFNGRGLALAGMSVGRASDR